MADKFLFPRLNNNNYQTWKIRMEAFLKREDVWFVIQDPKPEPVTNAWKKRELKCHSNIMLYIDDSQLHRVKDIPEAKDVWETLRAFHESATMTSRVSLLKRICNLNMSEGGDLDQHLQELDTLFDRLSCAGQAIDDSLKIAMIHRSLPDSYNGLVMALESRPDADLTIDFVKQKLLDESQRRAERSGGKSGASHEQVMKAKDKKRKVCFYCQKPGHFKAQSRLLQQHQQQQQNKKGDSDPKNTKRESKAKQAAEKDPPVCFTVSENSKGGCWYIDSGCSSHMTSEKSFFAKLDRNVKTEVILADGSVTKACGIGEGTVRCVDGGGAVKDITIDDVLYIPTLNSGLISVRKLTQKGFEVNFSASWCTIVSEAGSVVATGETSGNLYVLNTAEHAKLGKVMQHLRNCQHTWHRRMGHRDAAVLERAQELSDGVEVKAQTQWERNGNGNGKFDNCHK